MTATDLLRAARAAFAAPWRVMSFTLGVSGLYVGLIYTAGPAQFRSAPAYAELRRVAPVSVWALLILAVSVAVLANWGFSAAGLRAAHLIALAVYGPYTLLMWAAVFTRETHAAAAPAGLSVVCVAHLLCARNVTGVG